MQEDLTMKAVNDSENRQTLLYGMGDQHLDIIISKILTKYKIEAVSYTHLDVYKRQMHAYDYDTLAGHEIVVRRARADEKFVTLDGQERTMDENVLMICDGEKAVGIAGIMGGEN